LTAPNNLISVTIRGRLVKSLIDTGSNQNIMSQRLHSKLFPPVNHSKQNETVANNSDLTLLSANASQMKIIATIDTDIRILGLQIPVTFRVVPDLVYDLILGRAIFARH
jgi:hypothetical protein